MSYDNEFLTGDVTEPTVYVPVPAGRYQARIVKAELVDPEVMGWAPSDELTEAERVEFLRPFVRLRWEIISLPSGDMTEYSGRLVDQRVSLRSGVNPKTGRPYAEARADLLRLANGLGAKAEVIGMRLFEIPQGVDKEEAVAIATDALRKYEGLTGIVHIAHLKNRKTGEVRDSVTKIILPKEE